MTTAQSPVEVLRAALEQVIELCWKAGMTPRERVPLVDEVARNALDQAAALAAEVPVTADEHWRMDTWGVPPAAATPPNPWDYGGSPSVPMPPPSGSGEPMPNWSAVTRCQHCHNGLSERGRCDDDTCPRYGLANEAAPPPAPVPGGMLPTGSIALFFDGERYRLTVGDVEATITWPAAATPHEVVVGMPLKACKECGHSHWEHRREEPHACALCLCAAFDDVKMGGKLLASHPLVKPPSTPPVQQQGEAGRVAHRLVGQLGAHPLPVDVSCSAAEDRIALALMAAWRETGESEQRARNTALRDAAEKLRSHVRELASEHQDADYMTGFAAAALVVELLAAPEMPGTTTRETLPADMAECRVCGKRFRHPAPGTGGQWTCSYECRMGHRAVSTPAPSKGTPPQPKDTRGGGT